MDRPLFHARCYGSVPREPARMTLFLVGGCARSGKSLLAERMRRDFGIPHFPLDALKMGLHKGEPSLGIDPATDDLKTADRLWPIVEGLLDHLVFDGRDYLVEGVNLRPATVAAFIADSDTAVRCCFLGYPDADLEAKARDVERHVGVPTDWLHRTGPDHVARYLRTCRALSRNLREQAYVSGLRFFDTGHEFSETLDAAMRYLFGDA